MSNNGDLPAEAVDQTSKAPPSRVNEISLIAARSATMKRVIDSVFPLLALGFAGIFLQRAITQGLGKSYAYPMVMIVLVGVLGFACLASAWLTGRRRHRDTVEASGHQAAVAGAALPARDAAPSGIEEAAGSHMRPRLRFHVAPWAAAMALLANLIVFVALMQVLGVLIAVPLFLISTMAFLGYRKPIPVIAIALLTTFAIWAIFQQLLLIELPSGIWGLGFDA